MAQNIVGLFPDRVAAEHAIVDLRAAGFDTNRMGIVMRDRSEAREVANDQGLHSTTGAVTGSLLGGTLGAIVAATGAFVIPGIGPFISGGILATSLVGGAAGWLVGGLVGLGIPHEEAEYYQGRVEEGGVLLTVESPTGREAAAQQIMLNNGAEDLRDRGYGGYTPAQTTAAPMAAPMPTTPTPTQTTAAPMQPMQPMQPVQPVQPVQPQQRPMANDTAYYNPGMSATPNSAIQPDQDVLVTPNPNTARPMTDEEIIAQGRRARQEQQDAALNEGNTTPPTL